MSEILARRSGWTVREATDGAPIEAAVAYVAPPNRHLLVAADGQSIALSDSPVVQHVRPSADLLFRSVAVACGERAIAVVLTGSGKDGAAAVCEVKQAGGMVIAQDQVSAEFHSMPRSAIETGCVDQVLPLGEIGAALSRLLIGHGDGRRA
jgi:two-component system chemotaxis response regulator CheB